MEVVDEERQLCLIAEFAGFEDTNLLSVCQGYTVVVRTHESKVK